MNITQTMRPTSVSVPASPHSDYKSLSHLAEHFMLFIGSLKQEPAIDDVTALQKNVMYELQQFVLSAKNAGHHKEACLVSQFVLAQHVDHSLSESAFASQWQPVAMSKTLPQYQQLNDHFASALQTMCQQPDAFIDVLELLYLCQSLSSEKHPPETLPTQSLYHIIRHQRGEPDHRLSCPPPKPYRPHNTRLLRFVSVCTITLTIILISGLFLSYNVLLKTSEQPLKTQLQQING
jgi:type IV/VI secretion system ImpK/VasF family protein